MAEGGNVSTESSRRTVHEIFEEVQENARNELSRSSRALAFSGLAGGITMGLTPQAVMIWLLALVVGAGHFAHCIATSGEIIAAVIGGPVPMSSYFHWLLFATAGNVFGGVTIVSLLNWGQVHASEDSSQKKSRQEPRRAA